MPALQGIHQLVFALMVALLILANAFLLYIFIFKLPRLAKLNSYQKFPGVLNEISGDSKPDSRDFERAYRRWKDLE